MKYEARAKAAVLITRYVLKTAVNVALKKNLVCITQKRCEN